MSVREMTGPGIQAKRIYVWDPLIRIVHWGLVAAFALAFLSAEDEAEGPSALHIWGGYVIAGLVAFRVLWGFVGPRHARFSDFVRGPVATVKYMVDLIAGGARRYVGHSPAGGAMTLALLLCLTMTVSTGIIAYGGFGKGLLADAQSAVTVSAHAEEDSEHEKSSGEGRTNGESAIGDLHSALANITLALVVLHILGVGLASFVHRENLVAAMVTGSKRADN